MAKTYLIKVSDVDNRRVLATWTDASFDRYTWQINGGLGLTDIRLARDVRDFGEGLDVAVGNRVTIDIHDKETNPEGRRVYSGYIYEYDQEIVGNQVNLVVHCIGNQARFATRLLEDSIGNTTITYNSQDPAYMFKDIIEKANIGGITTTPTSVDNVGTTSTITFYASTVKDALDKVVELAGKDFYWYVDATNVAYLRKIDHRRVDHVLTYGKHFNALRVKKTIRDLVNEVFFVGGGDPNLYRKYTRSGSKSSWGSYQKTLVDQRVTTAATAETFATTELDTVDHPLTKAIFTLADSNISGETGFDIESLAPGQVVRLENIVDRKETLWDVALWDVDYWDYDITNSLSQPQIIQKVDYTLGSATIEVGSVRDHIANEILNIRSRVDVDQFVTLPSSPS